MILALALAALGSLRQEEALAPGTPVDFELRADDEPLLEGRGPTRVFAYEVEATGFVYVHLVSEELDPCLRIEAEDGTFVAADDDRGGGTAAFLRLELERGTRLYVLAAAQRPAGHGRATLAVHEAPRTPEATAAVGAVRERLAARPDQEECRRLFDELSAVPGSATSTEVAEARIQLGFAAFGLGGFELAERAFRASAVHRARVLPPDHMELAMVRSQLSAVLVELGQLTEAKELLVAALESFPRSLPATDEDVLIARSNLADLHHRMGDDAEARRQQLELVAVRRDVQKAGHPALLLDRVHLAVFQAELGDLGAARAVLQDVIADCQANGVTGAVLPLARQNLAWVLQLLGDAEGALTIFRSVLRAREETLPEGHPQLQQARIAYALALVEADELEEAIALSELVVETGMDPGDARILWARNNMAEAIRAAEDPARALELLDGLARDLEEYGYGGSLLSQFVGRNRGEALRAVGEPARAAVLLREFLETRGAILTDAHEEMHSARLDLARALLALEQADEARDQLRAALAGLAAWTSSGLALAPRERRQRIAWATEATSIVLALLAELDPDPALARRVFEVIESIRAGEVGGSRVPATEELSAELAALREEVLVSRRAVDDLAQRWAARPDEELGPELADRILARDRAEAELSRGLVEQGRAGTAIDADSLAAALDEDEAAVGFTVVGRGTQGDFLVAHVLQASGDLARVDLGPLDHVERAVADWRLSIGRALRSTARGERIVAAGTGPDADALGANLRALVVDPVLAVAGPVQALYVCLDGPLHLVPLDALPRAGDGAEVVGDAVAIRTEVSFARLVAAPAPARGGDLFALGGVDFDATGSVPEGEMYAPVTAPTRSGAVRFAELPATRSEVEEIAALFRANIGGGVQLVTGEGATKEAFVELAPRAGYLHLATHGYFAAYEHRARYVVPPLAGLGSVHAAPLALCGLALAGANRGLDAFGRAPGVLTGEELSGLDLSSCTLATLSACETNVGEVENGRSVLSLQAALRAAGVRTAVTSLWKVPDAETRALMVAFYRLLWSEGRAKADALWEAKRTLRARGAPTSAWAAWVLTGDPD